MPTYQLTSIGELMPGSVLRAPAFDDRRFKLIDAGTVIDQQLIDRLQARGITEVVIEHPSTKPNGQPKMIACDSIQSDAAQPVEVVTRVDRSCICGRKIAFRPPTRDSQAIVWICNGCEAIYFGSEDGQAESCGLRLASSCLVNPFTSPAVLATDAPPLPPENIQRLVHLMTSGQQPGAGQRKHKRYAVIIPVVALPLGRDFRSIGEPVKMTTANVSLGGAALIHTRFLDAPYLALDFTITRIELLLVFEVLRVQSRGVVYEIGGKFISRLAQSQLLC